MRDRLGGGLISDESMCREGWILTQRTFADRLQGVQDHIYAIVPETERRVEVVDCSCGWG